MTANSPKQILIYNKLEFESYVTKIKMYDLILNIFSHNKS